MDSRLLSGNQENNEEIQEQSLRPKYLSQYIGQNQIKENLKVFIEAAKMRNEVLDHCLLYGPPGLGSTKDWKWEIMCEVGGKSLVLPRKYSMRRKVMEA